MPPLVPVRELSLVDLPLLADPYNTERGSNVKTRQDHIRRCRRMTSVRSTNSTDVMMGVPLQGDIKRRSASSLTISTAPQAPAHSRIRGSARVFGHLDAPRRLGVGRDDHRERPRGSRLGRTGARLGGPGHEGHGTGGVDE